MPVIPSRLIAQIQREAGQAYTTTCDIYERVGTQNPSDPYASSGSEVMVATGITCRVIYSGFGLRSGDNQVSDKKAVTQEYRIALPVGTLIEASRLIVLSDGGRWWVTGIDDTLTDEAWVMAIVERDSSNVQ